MKLSPERNPRHVSASNGGREETGENPNRNRFRSSPFPPSAQLIAPCQENQRKGRARGSQKLAPSLGPAGGSDVTDTTVTSFHSIPPSFHLCRGPEFWRNKLEKVQPKSGWKWLPPNLPAQPSHCNSKSVRMPPSLPFHPSIPLTCQVPRRCQSLPSNVPTCSSLPHHTPQGQMHFYY